MAGSFEEVNKNRQPGGVFQMTITVLNPDLWDRFLNLTPDFLSKYKELFLSCVFESHRYLIRTTPIRTGRLRGGWTSILDKYNQDYTRAFYDVTLLHIPSDSEGVLDAKAVEQGKSESSFQDQYPSQLDITITNEVHYGGYVEFGTSRQEAQNFTNRARYKAELIFTKSIEDWLTDISNEGDIVDPKPVEEMVA